VKDEKNEWVGRRVVGEINCAMCEGACRLCKLNRSTHCLNRTVLGIFARNGCHGQYVTLPISNLLEVPESVSDDEAVFCEPLAAALEICKQVHIGPKTSVLIIGSGKLGLLVAAVLSMTSCNSLVALREKTEQTETEQLGRQKKLQFLKNLHVNTITTTKLQEPAYQNYFEVVVEATGTPDGFYLAQKVVIPAGTIVLKSTYHGATEIDMSQLVVKEVSIVGSRCGAFGPALRLLQQKTFDITQLISATYPIEQALKGIAHASEPGAIKVILKNSIGSGSSSGGGSSSTPTTSSNSTSTSTTSSTSTSTTSSSSGNKKQNKKKKTK